MFYLAEASIANKGSTTGGQTICIMYLKGTTLQMAVASLADKCGSSSFFSCLVCEFIFCFQNIKMMFYYFLI